MQPAPASTVALVRDGDAGIETFILRRAASMGFAPGMHVFPGGRVDARDYDVDVSFVGPDGEHERLARRASADLRDVSALYACAVREMQEETGVELVVAPSSRQLVIDPVVMPIADHWVTPVSEGHRYDVRFFAAALPSGQHAVLQTTEADVADWTPVAAAVQRFTDGTMAMLPPTITMVRYMAGFTDCATLLADAAVRPVVPLLPTRTITDDGSAEWTLVHDLDGRP